MKSVLLSSCTICLHLQDMENQQDNQSWKNRLCFHCI
ncbi:unnamed protein product [Thelazia callipaeda]|uniref:Uncharacterized protein n=1 Tax=Thelazia callipaeda TaxID=103827 RepID=A0A0N5D7R6_THECL|nr:unnamed protein product [Thelazia callipaeda]